MSIRCALADTDTAASSHSVDPANHRACVLPAGEAGSPASPAMASDLSGRRRSTSSYQRRTSCSLQPPLTGSSIPSIAMVPCQALPPLDPWRKP